MEIIFYSAKRYDNEYFNLSNEKYQHKLRFVEDRLTPETVDLIKQESVVCAFVNDVLDQGVLSLLAQRSVKLVALRCAGFDNVDLNAAKKYNIKVIRVGSYSPNSVAEHALCLMLALNRKVYKSYNRVKDGNFSIDGLLGFDFSGKTIGIIGTGKIGLILSRITQAMGMRVIAYDLVKNPECEKLGVEYVDIDTVFTQSDVISLHCSLNKSTKHFIDASALNKMKDSVMLINTSRGAVIDTCAAVEALKSKKIGYLGMDVYENEQDLFFEDLSCQTIEDSVFNSLLSLPNVLITSHQGFFTKNALENIANTTLGNIQKFEQGIDLSDEEL